MGYAGSRLSRCGDIIADTTGVGATRVGLVLPATVASLTELLAGISSVAFAGVPDIAVGDVLGSCVFNPLLGPGDGGSPFLFVINTYVIFLMGK